MPKLQEPRGMLVRFRANLLLAKKLFGFIADVPAMFIVGGNAEVQNLLSCVNAELLVNFKLNGQAVAVPAKAPLNEEAVLVGEATDDILWRQKNSTWNELREM